MTERKRLLIVDDDPEYVEGIKGILDAADYETDVAYNPKQGFDALKARHYDLVLLDIMMGRGAEGVMIQGLQILNFGWGIVLGGTTNCTLGGDRAVGAGPMGQGNLVSGNSEQGIQCAGTSNVIIGNFVSDNGEAGSVWKA